MLDDIDREGVDTIINCGDTLGGPLESAKTAALLMARGIPMVAGNHERQLLTWPPARLSASDACTASEIDAAQRAWLAMAPPTMWLAEDVFVCHGTPSSDLHYWLETVTDDFGQHGSTGVRAASMAEVMQRLGDGEHTRRASLILCGHTHVPRVVQAPTVRGSVTIANAGSVRLPGCDDRHAAITPQR